MIFEDLRFAIRLFRKRWGIALVAVLSLSLAIAGNTLVFSLVNGLFWKPLPYRDADRLCLISEVGSGESPYISRSASTQAYLHWREQQASFSELAALRQVRWQLDNAAGRAPELAVQGAAVSENFFRVLGVEPRVGRVFSPGIDASEVGAAEGEAELVLTHGFWRRHFPDQAKPEEALGQSLLLDGQGYSVIGVLRPDFAFLDPRLELLSQLRIRPGETVGKGRDLVVVGRLGPGVDESTAEAEMDAHASELAQRFPDSHRDRTASVINLRHEIPDPNTRRVALLIQLVLVLVLLIAATNLANLLLALRQTRSREIALRSSLGASSARLARQLLTESTLLAIIGMGLGFLMVLLGLPPLRSWVAAKTSLAYAPSLDFRVLAFMAGASALVALLFGLGPVLQTTRLDLVTASSQSSPGGGEGPRRRLAARTLVVIEIALTMILLCGAGLVIRTLSAAQDTDPGFDTTHLSVIGIVVPESIVAKESEAGERIELLAEHLHGLPGLEEVAASNTFPRSPFVPQSGYALTSGTALSSGAEGVRHGADLISVGPGYFETVDFELLRGRTFDANDRAETLPVALINRALADKHWPQGDPLGQSLEIGGERRRVVGIVTNVLHGYSGFDVQGARPALYLPLAQGSTRHFTLLVRSRLDPAVVANTLRSEIDRLEPDLRLGQAITLEAYLQRVFAGRALGVRLLSAFGLLAMVLAVLGIWGLLAYNVSRRRREIGVRMALGADRRTVARMVLAEAMRLAVLGICLGAPGAWILAKGVSGSIHDAATLQPLIVLAIGVGIVVSALAAGLIPALRASRTNPIHALRAD